MQVERGRLSELPPCFPCLPCPFVPYRKYFGKSWNAPSIRPFHSLATISFDEPHRTEKYSHHLQANLHFHHQ